MEQARSFINKMKSGNRALKRAQLNVEIQSALPDQQLLYAFNIEDGGFVIVSGDDRTLPVLGYSLTGSIDADDMPDGITDTYWRNEATGDWLIGFAPNHVIYNNKVWDIASQTMKKDAYTLTLHDGTTIKVDKLKKG